MLVAKMHNRDDQSRRWGYGTYYLPALVFGERVLVNVWVGDESLNKTYVPVELTGLELECFLDVESAARDLAASAGNMLNECELVAAADYSEVDSVVEELMSTDVYVWTPGLLSRAAQLVLEATKVSY